MAASPGLRCAPPGAIFVASLREAGRRLRAVVSGLYGFVECSGVGGGRSDRNGAAFLCGGTAVPDADEVGCSVRGVCNRAARTIRGTGPLAHPGQRGVLED